MTLEQQIDSVLSQAAGEAAQIKKAVPFHVRKIEIALTGEEWFSLMSRVGNRKLSTHGEKVCTMATRKIAKILKEESE